MSNERLLRALADVVHEQEDERWEKLAHGRLSPAEEQELRQLSEQDPDAARRFAAYMPLDRATKKRIAEAVTATIRANVFTALQTIRTNSVRRGNGSDVVWMDLDGASAVDVTECSQPEPIVIDGKYLIERIVLGTGCPGKVYRALSLGHRSQPVALKMSDWPLAEHGFGALLREARALRRLTSKHAVNVLDFGRTGNRVYIAMELLSGLDLGTWLARKGALPMDTAVDFVLQACDAIAEAHSLGIIHRNIKPSNLFAVLRAEDVEHIKVLAFEDACLLAASNASDGKERHQATTLAGTLAYTAPEQTKGEVDCRADIWSLGVTLYELLTRNLPLDGCSAVQLLREIELAVGPQPLEVHGDGSTGRVEGMAGVLRKCLRPNREDRYGSVEELARALVPFGSQRAPVYFDQLAKRGR